MTLGLKEWGVVRLVIEILESRLMPDSSLGWQRPIILDDLPPALVLPLPVDPEPEPEPDLLLDPVDPVFPPVQYVPPY